MAFGEPPDQLELQYLRVLAEVGLPQRWAELVARYDRGVATVDDMGRRWAALGPDIDAQRHAEVTAYLAVQAKEARWWRDACIAYFQSVSGLPLPAGVRPPEHRLQYYKGLRFGFAPGRG